MALPQAKISPTIKEKRYNTLNFLEASVMGGNKVHISEVDSYQISDLSGERFTYKEAIETYITFDARPSVKLLRSYGWFREDADIQPIVAYIPTHLLYDKSKLTAYRDYTNQGIPNELVQSGKTIYKISEDFSTVIYVDESHSLNWFSIFFKQPNNTYEEDLLVTNYIQSYFTDFEITNIYMDQTADRILVTSFDEVNNVHRNILFTRDKTLGTIEVTPLPEDYTTTNITSVYYHEATIAVTTIDSLVILNLVTGTQLATTPLTSPCVISDYNGEIVILERHILTYHETYIYRFDNSTLTRLDTGVEAISLTKGVVSPDGKTIAVLDTGNRLRVYNRTFNTLAPLYYIYLNDLDLNSVDVLIDDANIYIVGKSGSTQESIFKVFEYDLETYINHANLFIDLSNETNIGYTTIYKLGNTIYLVDSLIGAYAKITSTGYPNYSKAVANYTLLTGEDIQPIIETGESSKYLLNPLKIIRGTLVDIEYDFIENTENLFYVVDVKVDTVSVNYVANLMPYKYDKEPEGEPDTNIPMFNIDVRNQGI